MCATTISFTPPQNRKDKVFLCTQLTPSPMPEGISAFLVTQTGPCLQLTVDGFAIVELYLLLVGKANSLGGCRESGNWATIYYLVGTVA